MADNELTAVTAPEPLVIDDPDTLDWDDTTDVLVVGFGGAGACTALQARESGADVVIIDRFDGGGATSFSGGIIYAGDTSYQRAAGITDTPDDMYAYLKQEAGDVVRPETLRRYCDESGANIEWLTGHGVPYGSDAFLDKTMYPPDNKYIYYSGNEKVPEFAEHAKPAARGHRPVGKGLTGNVYFAALAKAVDKLGVRVRRHEKAVRLILDSSGRVIGVETARIPEKHRKQHQRFYAKVVPMVPFMAQRAERMKAKSLAFESEVTEKRRLRARGGVVLSTGGFAFNLEMLNQYRPFFADNYKSLMRLGTLGCDGSGISLGLSAGGATDRMESIYAASNISLPQSLLDGFMVNQQGRRFKNEEEYAGYLGLAVADQPEGTAWLVLPKSSLRTALRECVTSGWGAFKFFGMPVLINYFFGGSKRAGTVEDLAVKCGIDSGGLRETIDAADRDLKEGRPDSLGKSNNHRKPLGEESLVAINMSIPNPLTFTLVFTLGGLKVDENTGDVLRADGSSIPGLYAAGRAAVGICTNGYISGLSVGDGMFSGRRAGKSAAEAQG